jgi:hypothetical protein
MRIARLTCVTSHGEFNTEATATIDFSVPSVYRRTP